LRLVARVRLAVGRLPAKTGVGEPGRTRLPREVEVDFVESLPAYISPLRTLAPVQSTQKLTYRSRLRSINAKAVEEAPRSDVVECDGECCLFRPFQSSHLANASTVLST
jgi:hypothetical protein